jgi:aryl-alcohol dehydrogenase-like predicted oxidoreductase
LETVEIPGAGVVTSRIGLGTWAIGGWMWGGTDEAESIRAIRAAIDLGISLIDTAPAYGFGRSEELVGRAIEESGARDRVLIATKVGLEWRDGQVFRNASPARVRKEVEDSLRRLRTTTSMCIRFTGRIPWCPSRRRPGCFAGCSTRARSERSA